MVRRGHSGLLRVCKIKLTNSYFLVKWGFKVKEFLSVEWHFRSATALENHGKPRMDVFAVGYVRELPT